MTITEFLLARIAEDEAAARQDRNEPALGIFRVTARPGLDSRTVTRMEARVLAECEAKRRIAAMHDWGHGVTCSQCSNDWWTAEAPCPTVLILASVYADHPDFRPEWRA